MSCPSEVTGLAFDPTTNYLSACNQDGAVELYELDSMKRIFLISTKNILKAIAFGQMREGSGRDVVVFGHNGTMY
jgi:hypothetical protein